MEEVLGQGRVQLLSELVADDYVGHLAFGDHYGQEGVRIDIAPHLTAFPEMTVTVDDLLADGDKVVRRFTVSGINRGPFLGAPASGQLIVLRGIGIDRFEDGRIAQSWVHVDVSPSRT